MGISRGLQAFLALQCCCFHMLSVGQHSVEVDPNLSQTTCSCDYSSISYMTAGIALPAALLAKV